MNWMLSGIGQKIAAYLDRAEQGYEPFTPSDPIALRKTLRPGDVLLVEGNNHVSGVIKYLTQSTWSHAALYVGPIGERTAADGEPLRSGMVRMAPGDRHLQVVLRRTGFVTVLSGMPPVTGMVAPTT